MSNKRSQRRRRSFSKGEKGQAKQQASFVIPAVVVLVVAALITGFVVIGSGRQSQTAASGDLSVPIVTAPPFATQPIPYPDVPRITLQEAMDQQERGEGILVDVRSQDSYDKAHAAGAVWLPEDGIESHLDELPPDKLLILYCT